MPIVCVLSYHWANPHGATTLLTTFDDDHDDDHDSGGGGGGAGFEPFAASGGTGEKSDGAPLVPWSLVGRIDPASDIANYHAPPPHEHLVDVLAADGSHVLGVSMRSAFLLKKLLSGLTFSSTDPYLSLFLQKPHFVSFPCVSRPFLFFALPLRRALPCPCRRPPTDPRAGLLAPRAQPLRPPRRAWSPGKSARVKKGRRGAGAG